MEQMGWEKSLVGLGWGGHLNFKSLLIDAEATEQALL